MSDLDELMRSEVPLLEYVARCCRAGMRIFPVWHQPGHDGDKAPMPGYSWTEMATTNVAHAIEDFTNAITLWGEGNVMVAWAIGLDEYIAVDLDIPPDSYPNWVSTIAGSAAINVTKKGQHLIFRFPPGFTPGNGTKGFPTSGWGEVRGRHGYIVINGPDRPGFDPDDLELARPFPKPEWLEEYGGGAEAVSWDEVKEFAKKTRHANRMPNKLNGIREWIAAWDDSKAGDPAEGRHPSAVWLMTTVAEESLAGYYPFKDGYDLVHEWWQRVKPHHERAFKGICCWAIGRAEQQAPEATAEADDHETDELDLTPGERLLARLRTPDQLRAEPPQSYLIDKYVVDAGVTFLIGQSSTGKSFVALDMALTVATGGGTWNGRNARGGRVLYIAAEGRAGIGKRIEAWRRHHECDEEPELFVLGETRSLHSYDQTTEVVEMLELLGGVDLVIIDTLARSAAGADENSASDTGLIYANLDRIRAAAGQAAVMVVHHTGKDPERGARGSSAWYANADGEITVRGSTKTRIEVEVTKAKDDLELDTTFFRTEVVELGEMPTTGIGPEDEVPTSLVIIPDGTAAVAEVRTQGPVSHKQALQRDRLMRMLRKYNVPMTEGALVDKYASTYDEKIGKGTVNNALHGLAQGGWVVRLEETKAGAKPWSLTADGHNYTSEFGPMDSDLPRSPAP